MQTVTATQSKTLRRVRATVPPLRRSTAKKYYAMTVQSSFERAIQNGAGVPGKVPQNSTHQLPSNGNHSPASEYDEIANTNKNGVLIADDCHRLP
jgi:hypothetical protein